jgi:poly(A) polymerase Pap1
MNPEQPEVLHLTENGQFHPALDIFTYMDRQVIGQEKLQCMQRRRIDALSLVDKWVGEVVTAKAIAKKFQFDQKYLLLQFGSTMLEVESINSDIDLLVTTYDCLFDRRSFYLALEIKL